MVARDESLTLRVSEIFYSLQGEASRIGLPTVFVRLTGCPLRCSWCDTTHAFTGGARMSLDAILHRVAEFGTRHVCVTGGEPLAQTACLVLLTALCDAGYDVSLETSGALDVSAVDSRVSRIVDLKAPSSGETEKNLWANLACLTAADEIKFVVADRQDYEWTRQVIRDNRLEGVCPLLISPVQGAIGPQMLAEWVLADRLPVRFQLQLHKLLWGNMQGK
ncbi:7-carboxy-7-deazaguanine synthase QueE [Propionivibrio dicarboxylicus]|uniref:7-carboxy-7-deazaguanine synthase n=1 Tax=Propionivibrio dicarboxylicus TaxID=83767 RepID=A0A1G8LGQ3_9RHOO|nr:7-carboxy-7-deazaguanine synthase QueE [Propionivibrio dicarboxylicus]SDI54410.1 7-carboxy-7-deazaguanine synthase [Propionivibrio dicarboxylicus]